MRPLEQRSTTPLALSVATTQLSMLLGAGVALVPALRVASAQAQCPHLGAALDGVGRHVEQGNYLSHALARYPRMFSPTFLAMIKAGEASGGLGSSLTRLGTWLEAQDRLRRRAVAAATYPLFTLGLAALLTVILFTQFLPPMFEMFASSGRPLPLLTRGMMLLTHLATSPWTWIALSIAGYAVSRSIRHQLNQPHAAARWWRRLLAVPLFGPLLRLNSASRLAHNLATLLEAGMTFLTGWRLAAHASGNPALHHDSLRFCNAVEQGEPLADSATDPLLYPVGFAGWLQTAEQSGDMTATFTRMARVYELEAENRAAALSSLSEPLFIALMGGLTLVVLLSILLPLYGPVMDVTGG